jgi:hypothetical protein
MRSNFDAVGIQVGRVGYVWLYLPRLASHPRPCHQQRQRITGDLLSLNAALLLFRERVLRFGPFADP